LLLRRRRLARGDPITEWHIAQLNVATALHPLEDERMAEFMGLLDSINALAEGSPGSSGGSNPTKATPPISG